MKKFLLVALFAICLLASSAHAQTCGPPLYPCLNSTTDVVNYPTMHTPPNPIPSWGANTCDSTSIYTMAQCGNLDGAGVSQTPTDFNIALIRATDAHTNLVTGVYNPMIQWQTADEPSVNLWNSDDTAMMLHVVNGNQFVFLWDGTAAHILRTPNPPPNDTLKFPSGTVWAKNANNHIYVLDNSTGPGVYLQDVTVTLTQNLGAATTSNLFDFTGTNCLMNTVNGYPTDPARLESVLSWTGNGTQVTFQVGTGNNHYVAGQFVTFAGFTGVGAAFNSLPPTAVISTGINSSFKIASTVTGSSSTGTATGTSFPLNEWTGAVSSTDGVNFVTFFSALPGQGSGPWNVAWQVGQSGCDIWNSVTNVITHNGTLVGTVADTQWTGAPTGPPNCPLTGCGGKVNRFHVHDGNAGSPTTLLMASGTSNFVYGSYNDGPYFWTPGTANVLSCGIGAPDWKANLVRKDGDRILPIPVGTNAGGFMYQMIDGLGGKSGSTEPTVWNQTPGSDTVETSGSGGPTGTGPSWRNVGIGNSTIPNSTYACDGHNWKGFLGTAVGKSYIYHSYADPSVPQLKLTPGVSSAGDQHIGNTNSNTTDTNWIWVSTSNAGTNADLLHSPLPGAIYGEGFFLAPPFCTPGVQNTKVGTGACGALGTLSQVRRGFHVYGSGWTPFFDARYSMCVVSQTGNYAMCPSDGFGQFGSTGGSTKCNIGGPDWGNHDSPGVTWQVGNLMYPNLGQKNAGNYIYKVLNCTANGGSGTCTRGSVAPLWPQTTTPGVTITENAPGTITWATYPDINNPAVTAVQNCRNDVLIAVLSNGTPPPTTQSTIIQGNTILQGNVIIQ